MGKRIADSERIERVREYARQSSARRRVKLTIAGKMQLLCWIPATLRAQLDATAAQRNQNLSEVTTDLLQAALTPATPGANPPPPPVDSLPLFDVAEDSAQREQPPLSNDAPAADRDAQILELKRQGLPNSEIGLRIGCSRDAVYRTLKRLNLAKADR